MRTVELCNHCFRVDLSFTNFRYCVKYNNSNYLSQMQYEFVYPKKGTLDILNIYRILIRTRIQVTPTCSEDHFLSLILFLSLVNYGILIRQITSWCYSGVRFPERIVPFIRTNAGLYSFQARGMCLWNSLPASSRHLAALQAFKTAVYGDISWSLTDPL